MWSGLGIDPDGDQSKCNLYLDHVHDNICGSDDMLNKYVLDWMASGVQDPGNPDRTAISLRGDPGAGKGVFATQYGLLFGRHFLPVTNPEHLTGKFNAHEAEANLIFADEVAFAGDPRAARIFKTKISEPTKLLERKGIDAVQIPNYARYIFSTNDDHPLRIEAKDRRYLAINVKADPERAADPNKRRTYFRAILKQMNDGGRAALLRFLLDRDISAFNAEDIPATDELNHQKLLSASAGDKVIIEFAQEGVLPGTLGGARAHIAVSNGKDCLFEVMERRGGRELWKPTPNDLGGILTRWRFTRTGNGQQRCWKAPALITLRENIKLKYPAVVWEHSEISDWGQPLCGGDDGKPDVDALKKVAEAAAAAVKAAEAGLKPRGVEDDLPF